MLQAYNVCHDKPSKNGGAKLLARLLQSELGDDHNELSYHGTLHEPRSLPSTPVSLRLRRTPLASRPMLQV